MIRTLTIATMMTLTACSAFAAGHAAKTVKISEEGYFTDANDMTLYTFDKDEVGVSNCYDACAEAWPPVLVEGDMMLEDGFSLIERTDGTMQVAYKDQPLYLWVNDMEPGQTTGDGFKDVWHLAKPE